MGLTSADTQLTIIQYHPRVKCPWISVDINAVDHYTTRQFLDIHLSSQMVNTNVEVLMSTGKAAVCQEINLEFMGNISTGAGHQNIQHLQHCANMNGTGTHWGIFPH